MKSLILLAALLYLATAKENDTTGKSVTISYSLWIGTNVTKQYNMKLTVKCHAKFYDVMMKAARRNPHYAFNATNDPKLGHYITTIAGNKQDVNASIYWMIYDLTKPPTVTHKPERESLSKLGVDKLKVQKGHHYLFWLQKVKLDATTTTTEASDEATTESGDN